MSEQGRPEVDAGPLVRAVAAHGLAGTSLVLPPGPLEDAEWEDLLHQAGRRRLIGLLAACVADGTLEVTPSQLVAVDVAHSSAMTRALDIEVAALHAVEVLEQAGLGVRVLKGLAVAHVDMPDPSQREFSDADLLVEPGAFRRAIDVLTTSGLRRDLPERRAGFDERFGKDATLYGRGGVEIDLHRTLALGAFGLALAPSTLWDEGEPFPLGGCELRALRPEARLVHACYSAILADRVPRMATLRDIAQLAARPELSVHQVVQLAERGRGGIVVARALRLAGETLGAGPDWGLWGWATSRAASGWERAALASYESQGGSNTASLLSGLLALHTNGERLAYVAALGFPDRAYVLARRRAGRPGEWARGVRELARRYPSSDGGRQFGRADRVR